MESDCAFDVDGLSVDERGPLRVDVVSEELADGDAESIVCDSIALRGQRRLRGLRRYRYLVGRDDPLDQPFVLLQSQQTTPQLALHLTLRDGGLFGDRRSSIQFRSYGSRLDVVVCSIGWPSLLKKALVSVSVAPSALTE